ncbi:hypothetical protein CKO38_15360 [Rhodospirillum rubrum]|nr:hypothetical protein [Rhodospirillum rubrum]MBK1678025.1 hypothetical protein [Rhodospirillum rubrum]
MKPLFTLALLGPCLTLAACASSDEDRTPSRTAVQYSCGTRDEQDLTVLYSFEGERPVAANVAFEDRTLALKREDTAANDPLSVSFAGDGYRWSIEALSPQSVPRAGGGVLSRNDRAVIDGVERSITLILAKHCAVHQMAVATR